MAGSEGNKLVPKRYRAVYESFNLYWKAYGGIIEIIKSLYFLLSFILLLLTIPMWAQPNWWDMVISILPNLIGFSIGGFAIWMSFGDESFKAQISGHRPRSKTKVSPFMGVNSSFVHFIILQIFALFYAIISKALFFHLSEIKQPLAVLVMPLDYMLSGFDVGIWRIVFWGIGFWIFLYSLMTAIAATLSILRVASWYDRSQTLKKAKQDKAENAAHLPTQQ